MLNSKVASVGSRRSLPVVATIATMLALSISSVQAAPAAPPAPAKPSTPPAPSTAPVSLPAGAHLPPVPTQGVPTGAAQIAQANKALAGDAPDSFSGAKPTGILGPVLAPILSPILGPVLGPLGPPLGVAPQPTTELTGRRNATSKTFATTTPGQLVSQAYSGPIQFRGPDGVMHDTDPTLVASSPGRFAVKAAPVGVDLASSPTDPSLATVSFDAGHSVAFGLSGALPGAAAAPQTAAGPSAPSIVHPAILPNVNLELKAGSGGLKETIVLTAPSAPERLSFPLHLNGVSASVDAASGDVDYRDSTGTIVGRTPHGSMTDSKIDPRSGEAATSTGVTYSMAGTGSDVTLTVALDHAWLTDPARLFPVSVDPTISPANTSSDDTYAYSLSPPGPTFSNATDFQLKVGTYNGGTNKARSFMHFDNLGAINGQQVSSATLQLYNFHSYNCAASTTNVYQVTQAWSGPAVTMFPGPSLGALAGSGNFALGDMCGNPGWVSIDVTAAVANWAATNGSSNLGLAVVSPDENNSNLWKLFYSWDKNSGATSTTPYLNITWNSAATAPSPPTNATAKAANTSANITWNLSTNNGGSPITAYYVNAFDGNTGAYIKQVSVCGTCTSATVADLTNNYPYFFGVYALNSVNFSAPDYTATVTPTVPPAAPQGAIATPGNGLASVVWAPPVPNGGTAVNGYAVLAYYTNNTYSGHDTLVCATCYTATVAGLTNGVAYNLFVFASNPAGYGPPAASGPITVNANVPGPPTAQVAYVPGTASIGVQWKPAASSGSAAISQYAVNTYDLATGFVATSAVIVCPCGGLMFTAITGLTTGHSYFFAVYAYNSYGYGPVAITATASPNPAAPGPPANAVATPGDTTIAVSWNPPAAGGTTTIDSYLYGAVDQADGSVVGLTVTCPCTNPVTANDTGLTDGHSYQVAVYAHNTAGYGPPAASNIVTLMPPPPPPTTTTTSTTVPTSTTTSTVPSTTTTVPSTTTTTVPSTTTTTVPSTTTTTVPSTTTTTVPSTTLTCYQPADHCWGVDRLVPSIDQASLDSARDKLGNGNYPDFVGRYLTRGDNSGFLTASEVQVMKQNHVGIYLLADLSGTCNQATVTGKKEADTAATAAQALGLNPGTGVAIYLDEDEIAGASSACMQDYADELTSKGYKPGFYLNPGNEGTQYCLAISDPNVLSAAVFSDESEIKRPDYTRGSSPSFSPNKPSCGNAANVFGWQYIQVGGATKYGQAGLTYTFDVNELAAADQSTIWVP